ncbi:MAG: fatty-acyl-CoA synthase [Kribbellaceae bacterium]|nr:fatty-acyl-CoA synthase [Kribbellaceae bacterium]
MKRLLFTSPLQAPIPRSSRLAEVASLGVPDEEFGQRLRLYVVLADGSTLDGDAIRRHVNDNLARYKVPREVVFLDELPRTATGKVYRPNLEGKDTA